MLVGVRSAAGESALLVVGAPRSGTTLVYKAVCLHDGTTWLSNYHARTRLAAADVVVRLARGSALRRRTWFDASSNAYVFGAPRPLAVRAFPTPVEGDPLWERALRAPAGPPTRVRVARLLRGARRWGGGEVVVAKRIASNRELDRVLAALPSARVVHVVRDGRSVARSLRVVDWWPQERVWWLGRTPREWEAAGGDPWELVARHWVEEVQVIRGALAALDPARVLEVRYEHLVADPTGVLERLREFAGLPPDPSWSRQLADLRIGPRPVLPTPGAATPEVVERHQRDLLEALGYR